jgi:ribose transport system ATP-binding protein
MEGARPRLVARGIGKTFGTTRALDDVSFELRPGSVHAILGENGAGKSTLMRIVAGAERPDAGTLLLDGASYAPNGPLDARRQGVAIVYQELSVCPDLSVAENVVLGAESSRFGWIDSKRHEARVLRALEPIATPASRFSTSLTSSKRFAASPTTSRSCATESSSARGGCPIRPTTSSSR